MDLAAGLDGIDLDDRHQRDVISYISNRSQFVNARLRHLTGDVRLIARVSEGLSVCIRHTTDTEVTYAGHMPTDPAEFAASIWATSGTSITCTRADWIDAVVRLSCVVWIMDAVSDITSVCAGRPIPKDGDGSVVAIMTKPQLFCRSFMSTRAVGPGILATVGHVAYAVRASDARYNYDPADAHRCNKTGWVPDVYAAPVLSSAVGRLILAPMFHAWSQFATLQGVQLPSVYDKAFRPLTIQFSSDTSVPALTIADCEFMWVDLIASDRAYAIPIDVVSVVCVAASDVLAAEHPHASPSADPRQANLCAYAHLCHDCVDASCFRVPDRYHSRRECLGTNSGSMLPRRVYVWDNARQDGDGFMFVDYTACAYAIADVDDAISCDDTDGPPDSIVYAYARSPPAAVLAPLNLEHQAAQDVRAATIVVSSSASSGDGPARRGSKRVLVFEDAEQAALSAVGDMDVDVAPM